MTWRNRNRDYATGMELVVAFSVVLHILTSFVLAWLLKEMMEFFGLPLWAFWIVVATYTWILILKSIKAFADL